ncbi:cation:proton antiporter [Gemella sp. oral taxon 928]|uniref:Na+/H+ antiporter subunit E n=1 Tax=unclassified Gemella TaxID=2624949 RepID=UPI0007680DAB|nr:MULTISPECIES: Na+/H+ antiporter subunit E [unclassified Gemella]AME09918.1 cation:proton antiporter [Gemella sp. oral taxon 928]AXI26056.1 Na+/H+ antiporter subunit E [Gemella sp. ND 6198]
MAIQFLINIFIGILWMFFSGNYNLEYFFVGYFWGMVILFIFRKIFFKFSIGKQLYYTYAYKWLKLIVIFLVELLKAGVNVLKMMFRKNLDVNPVIFEYELTIKKNWQITLLANMITLTPGTLTVNVGYNNKTLFVHCLDTDNIEGEIESIKNSFEKAILEVDLNG